MCVLWMDNDSIMNFFKEKLNVVLQKDWLDEVTIYLRSLVISVLTFFHRSLSLCVPKIGDKSLILPRSFCSQRLFKTT